MSSSQVIVVFKQGTPKEAIDQAARDLESQGGKVGHRYEATILGFSATVPDNHFTTLSAHPHLDFIEADGTVSIAAKKFVK
ncbi:hypothetical protein BCR44DRAFT_122592 [Catenaria anguillulae PL171]|uniref:Inhibitor I9 domain-containing protein n=1 Tax=Catenaria anguillulae PL171 TaxID=765915 RepID=A0A1Y2HE46_9FUNG|nr:hypothetical protein BCR44DRAFT_122592 [Catenaria anguillulae PL171]